jgi:hypothetical protein
MGTLLGFYTPQIAGQCASPGPYAGRRRRAAGRGRQGYPGAGAEVDPNREQTAGVFLTVIPDSSLNRKRVARAARPPWVPQSGAVPGTKKIVDLKRKNVFSLVNRLPNGFRQSLPA